MIAKQINPVELTDTATLPSTQLIVILGPTASGKTALAVQLAQKINGAIISADSRQVYQSMDIGTGKDLDEYQDIPYYLINICQPGEKYNIARFQQDFYEAYEAIRAQGQQVILCGGTGLYIQSILQGAKYSQVPVNEEFRASLANLTRTELQDLLAQQTIPSDFQVDNSTTKRLIRALEILNYLATQGEEFTQFEAPFTQTTVIGLNPDLALRRAKISKRLMERLSIGMIAEVEGLLAAGISHEELIYYGLEYKYISLYLQGQLSYTQFVEKLEVEIHRYAKRQMTYFRKMEKDGIAIQWITHTEASERLEQALASIKKGII